MKKILISFSLLVVLGLVTCSCNRQIPLVPAGMTTPTPTATSTPAITSTPVCVYGTSTAVGQYGTPVTFIGAIPTPTPAPYTGSGTYVIQNLTEWQTVFGTTPPPANVNFATQMIVGGYMNKICNVGPDLLSVCEGSTQIMVMVSNPIYPIVMCNTDTTVNEWLVVPQSNLPVVWYMQ
ncbi:MAG TPA: hypothetical protein VN963_03495 [bacterium]|nr:hypothetical protein [bacterium]